MAQRQLQLLLAALAVAVAAAITRTTTTGTLAAQVTPTMGASAYFSTATCPPGWTLSPHGGRLIKGATANVGATWDVPLAADTPPAAHTHTFNTSVPQAWGSLDPGWMPGFPNIRPGNNLGVVFESWSAATGPVNTPTNWFWKFEAQFLAGTTGGESDSLPFVSLTLCEFTSGTAPPFHVPVGLMTFFADGGGACPTGFAPYNAADGRFLVVAAPDVVTVVNSTNSATPVSAVGAIGRHAHVTPNHTFTPFQAGVNLAAITNTANYFASQPAYYTGTATFGSVPTSSADLGLPTAQLRVCVAMSPTTDAAVAATLPPDGSIFFSANAACPESWRDAANVTGQTSLAGRLIVARAGGGATSPLTTFGSSTPLSLATSGTPSPRPHFHGSSSSWTSTRDSWCYYLSAAPTSTRTCGQASPSSTFKVPQTGPYSISFQVSSVGLDALVPYAVLRACTPPLPSASPTRSPTLPTRSPTLQPTQVNAEAPGATGAPGTGAPTTESTILITTAPAADSNAPSAAVWGGAVGGAVGGTIMLGLVGAAAAAVVRRSSRRRQALAEQQASTTFARGGGPATAAPVDAQHAPPQGSLAVASNPLFGRADV